MELFFSWELYWKVYASSMYATKPSAVKILRGALLSESFPLGCFATSTFQLKLARAHQVKIIFVQITIVIVHVVVAQKALVNVIHLPSCSPMMHNH